MNGRTAIHLSVTRAAAAAALVALGVGGCAERPVQPRPGAAAVVLEVGAKPKSGGAERFARVPVYDAAPRPAAASGQYERVDYAALDDIVVWLEPAEGAAAAAATAPATVPAPLIVQIDPAKPSDDVHAASVGQEIVFHNRGNSPASLYSVSDENDFESMSIEPGGSGRYTVRAPGLIEVLADPSQPPVAVVYAVPTPWVACTRAGESVVFRDVPPGAYQALSWHPRLPGKSAPLSLAPDEVTRSTLDVGVKNISAEGPQR